MIPLTERYADILGDQDDPALLACVADLDATRAVLTLPPECDAATARILIADAPLPGRPAAPLSRHRLTSLRWPARRWRLAPLLLAVLLVGSGLGVYLHGAGPSPVNAQTILHRAAAVTSVPNEATHSIYRITASGGYTGTVDVWVGTDAQGAPSEFAFTASMSLNGQPDPGLDHRGVMTNQESQAYDPVRNTITVTSPPSGEDQQFEGVFVAALVARTMNKCQVAVQQQTLDGVPVYALRFDESNQAVYFNTQSYVLEGSDWTQNWEISSAWQWHARLDPAGYHTMPLSAVPPHTFSLNAPGTAQVVPETSPQPASGIQGCPAASR
jgi:hypothetical protein